MSFANREQLPSSPRAPSRAVWIAIAVVVMLVAVVIWAQLAARPTTAAVVRRDIVAELTLQGEVVAPPLARADVQAPYQATVAKVYTSRGQRVRRGEVLVELSHPTAQAAYEQARQALKSAEEAHAEARRQYEAPVREAKEALEAARSAERAARERASATPEAEPAPSAENDEPVTVRERGAELQQAIAARQAAQQRLAQAEAEREAALAPYRRALEAARTAFNEAQSGRKETLVRAPIGGTVLALNARPGQAIGAEREAPVATLVDLGALQVHAPMSAEQASALESGLPAVVTVEGLRGQQFRGRVASVVSEAAGPLRGERDVAIVAFENEDGLVKPEIEARVSVQTGEARDVLAVPIGAVGRDESGRPVVQVLRDRNWQPVVVETGLSDGEYTAIRSGLEEGETVQVRRGLAGSSRPG